MLNTIVHGEATDRPPLVIAHGLFGSGRNWGIIAKRLSDARQVIAVDMRNHSGSFWDDDHSYPALAADLAGVIEHFGGHADLMGHSMGGKAAMVLALTRPELLGRLIVADIAPVAYGHSQLPVLDAMAAVDLSRVTRRSEADDQLKAALPEAGLRAFLLQSLEAGPDGARWRLNLSALRDQMPLIMGFPGAVAPSDVPAVFLRGGASHYVEGVNGEAALRLFPKGRIEVLEGAGHWLHADDPRGYEAMVREVLGA